MTAVTPLVSAVGATRRAAKHARVQHLIAADASGLAELETVLATLPVCATGRVFIEVADASQMGEVSVPGRMTVTWLDRSRRSGAPGTGQACPAGAALTRAVAAWAGEMLCGEDDLAEDQRTRIHVLADFLPAADILDQLTEAGVPSATIRTPERFGLTTAR